MSLLQKLLAVTSFLTVSMGFLALGLYMYLAHQLPDLFSVEDYEPLLVSEVYARGGEKIGEFYRENRILAPIEEIPKDLIHTFLAAEDSDFYSHNGFNYKGMLRALVVNLISGEKSQGASTITQQTARTLFLSSEKTYTRKLKEAILARRMEKYLSKEEILYLYLNQVYFGHGAHGVASAAETFFRKKIPELSLAEMAVLAGSLTAPSAYNIVSNPQRAKIRQRYVLSRMLETGRITEDQYDVAVNEVLTVYRKKKYKEVAPYFVETIRQLLVERLGEEQVLDRGLQIYSTLDFEAQKKAQESVRSGLRNLDKRRGYRGPKGRLDMSDEQGVLEFLTRTRNEQIDKSYETFDVFSDGSTNSYGEFKLYQGKNKKGQIVSNIPPYIKKGDVVEGVVYKVSDSQGLVFVKFCEAQGVIPFQKMSWARPVDTEKVYGVHLHIRKPSEALKVGDIIDVQILKETATGLKRGRGKKTDHLSRYAELSLEQEPLAQAALISFDLNTQGVLAMVGGSNFKTTQLNRTYQAIRQTGSVFKPLVYAASLDQGLTPATPIMGAPIVYSQSTTVGPDGEDLNAEKKPKDFKEKAWKPGNYGGRFTGDILVRNALKKSLNTPTIRIADKAGIPFIAQYARRLGVFSPINMDMSTALGSSSTSLYEMTKVYSVFARMGQKIKPIMIHEVKDVKGEVLVGDISLDEHFKKPLEVLQEEFSEKKERYMNKKFEDMQTGSNHSIQSTISRWVSGLSSPEENQENKTGEVSDSAKNIQKKSPFFFSDPNQLISPQTAYLITTLLQAVVNESGGTGQRAQSLKKVLAGKTGTTNGYYDAWFIGYSPQVSTGVWVGFDQEKSLGRGESGARAALPMWIDYMRFALKDRPSENFPIPKNIVFANIDNETGRLASATSNEVVRQAFLRGTQPGQNSFEEIKEKEEEDQTEFYRQEF